MTAKAAMERAAGELKTYDSDQTVMKKTKNNRKRTTQFGTTVSAKAYFLRVRDIKDKKITNFDMRMAAFEQNEQFEKKG